MKNFLFVTCLLFITASPFSKTDTPSSFKKLHTAECGSCTPAYNLAAQKNNNQLQLNWNRDPTVTSFDYGGYYNYYDNYGNPTSSSFGATTGGTQITITIPYSTYSVTYRVTSNCPDGSTTASSPYSIHF